MKQWQENNPQSWIAFDAAEGEIEFTTDGTCVNTTEDWKEMRVGDLPSRRLVLPHRCIHSLPLVAGINERNNVKWTFGGRSRMSGRQVFSSTLEILEEPVGLE